MKIIADSKIPFAREAFADIAEVGLLDTQAILPAAVHDADVLIVRSETRVNERLLGGSTVKFVGTSTIGIDHIDTCYLDKCGIGFASAPGSNANSVGEYLVAALLVLASRNGGSLAGQTMGVVGVGNVGTIVVKYARALGMRVLQNDPPLARGTRDPIFLALDELMTADVVTLHVPLIRSGPDPTYHLFDEERIRRMKRGSILVNTSRGGVVETGGIKKAVFDNHLAGCVLDVWEGEPAIDIELLARVSLGTPHIAGYSFDGKVNGIVMIHNAVCKYFGVHSQWVPHVAIGSEGSADLVVPEGSLHDEALLSVIRSCYNIETDDSALRGLLGVPEPERAGYFRRLRAKYRIRREFSNYNVTVPESQKALLNVLKTLGFKTSRGD